VGVSETEAAALFQQEAAEHARLVESVRRDLADDLARMHEMWVDCVSGGGKILLFGNGGSASQAQHIALELAVRLKINRPAIAGLSLASDASLLTAAANDMGFEQVFARQIEALGRPGDLALGISTSGRSANVNAGVSAARTLGLKTAAMTGGDGGRLAGLVDHAIIVPSTSTVRIQEIHLLLGHTLCASLERHLLAGQRPSSLAQG